MYSFEGAEGIGVDVFVDTVDPDTAFDPEACLSTTPDSTDCFAFADDDQPCTFPGPGGFDCPRITTTLPADDDGVYFLLVESGSGSGGFAGPVGEYEIQFDADPPGVTALQLVDDNQPGTF